MQLDEGKRQFIESWGQLGINWGTNKTMGMVHALLMMIDWGLVHKKFKKGERKEYFIAEKDVVTIFKAVISQRKKKELDPMLKVLGEISQVEGNCCQSNEFCKVVKELNQFSNNADKALTNLINTERKWILGALMKFMR